EDGVFPVRPALTDAVGNAFEIGLVRCQDFNFTLPSTRLHSPPRAVAAHEDLSTDLADDEIKNSTTAAAAGKLVAGTNATHRNRAARRLLLLAKVGLATRTCAAWVRTHPEVLQVVEEQVTANRLR